MERDLNDIFFACSYALDCIEQELVGVTTNHGKRVACISLELAKAFGMTEEEQAELAGCAVLHDSALTQFLKKEKDHGVAVNKNNISEEQLAKHCVMGEKNIEKLPFKTDVKQAILYHHENADGTGVFKKTKEETPLKAQIIHLADLMDATWHLDVMNQEKFEELTNWVKENDTVLFSTECVDAFLRCFSFEKIVAMRDDHIDELLKEIMPQTKNNYTDQDLYGVAALFAEIIDYKSSFTSRHSLGIAEKAKIMAEYYGYDSDKVAKIYFSGALHDIGKLLIVSDVLEKPDKLTPQEYSHIQNHAYATYDILNRIHGMEDITMWSSLHHERLDGTGYPFGKKAEELSKECRLMCCIDIYQALTEERPYKKGFSHEKAMDILKDMVARNWLDGSIVVDIDKVFSEKKAD